MPRRNNPNPLPQLDPVLRPRDAAEFLGIGKTSLYRLVAAGRLPRPIRLSAQSTGWRLSTLNAYLESAEKGAA
ncbi:helix-turn-helix transcriptional regulator [Ectothiorhodospira variabilis]|uniref:helix-turn-helix transcriptional regulator n=1 Tax=Ectothiorhodospira variabilis TaxID=505694 RepID=UPI001EFA79E9|nr:AlpA family phage regulatory protein [Ectothiorhodospira variabilis]MCG5495642.1 AlpA family phage regulatory protein [Ectothiorhodospira variabilis]MCG5504703.1 AlpA family phage regulatory protein [Ectothiorhodospira variabilis]MCG5507860.1 AlpA family phage regulatory protein [Ectothiorhodospira variabilis]